MPETPITEALPPPEEIQRRLTTCPGGGAVRCAACCGCHGGPMRSTGIARPRRRLMSPDPTLRTPARLRFLTCRRRRSPIRSPSCCAGPSIWPSPAQSVIGCWRCWQASRPRVRGSRNETRRCRPRQAVLAQNTQPESIVSQDSWAGNGDGSTSSETDEFVYEPIDRDSYWYWKQEAVGRGCEFLTNYQDVVKGKTKKRTKLSMTCVVNQLFDIADKWPRRIGNRLFVPGVDCKPLWLDSTSDLFAWIASQILADVEDNPIQWGRGSGLVTESHFYAYLTQNAKDYDDLEQYPHEPKLKRYYYMHPKPAGGAGKSLRRLLEFFCPATAFDCDLIRAFFLSMFWGGRAGSRPAFLFSGEEGDPRGGRGIGKSMVAQLGSRLAGGYISLSTGDKFGDLVTRLLSPEAGGKRIILLDNLKACACRGPSWRPGHVTRDFRAPALPGRGDAAQSLHAVSDSQRRQRQQGSGAVLHPDRAGSAEVQPDLAAGGRGLHRPPPLGYRRRHPGRAAKDAAAAGSPQPLGVVGSAGPVPGRW